MPTNQKERHNNFVRLLKQATLETGFTLTADDSRVNLEDLTDSQERGLHGECNWSDGRYTWIVTDSSDGPGFDLRWEID